MVATAQRFAEMNCEITISWRTRSLQDFADYPIEKLAAEFDLLVIDHPFCGYAAAHGTLLPLDEWLPKAFLDDQAAHGVGRSHSSYTYAGHHWALAVDAATPISGFRRDLMAKAGASPPTTWPELLKLARAGLVAVPAIPIDSLMNLYMLCGALGQNPFEQSGVFVQPEVGETAVSMLRQLILHCGQECLHRNPIATWELLCSNQHAVAYCPFAYGYSNYWRRGYAAHQLQAGSLIHLENHQQCRSTLGGTGLAISAQCRNIESAVEYARFVASEECQTTLYFDSGGQPGHRAAWLNAENNQRTNQFFADTLSTLDAAYLRPRFDGYLEFQDEACLVLHKFLSGDGSEGKVVEELNRLAARHRRAMEEEQE